MKFDGIEAMRCRPTDPVKERQFLAEIPGIGGVPMPRHAFIPVQTPFRPLIKANTSIGPDYER